MSRFRLGCLISLLLLALPWAVYAQSGFTLRTSPPLTDDFPTLTTYVQVWDAAGRFVNGLEARHFTVIEDGRYRAVDSLAMVTPGVQFVLAVQPGETLRIQDIEGRSRWDYLQAFWQHWAANRPRDADDYSLILADGSEITHRSDARLLTQRLLDYTPDFGASPTLAALSRALEVVSDPTPRPGMGRALLLVTPPLPNDAETAAGLQTAATLAVQNGVSVSVWLVGAPALAGSPTADLLRTLPAETGGQFAVVSAPEDMPALDPWLEVRRQAYRLTYTSRPLVGETHSLQIWLHAPQGEVTSEPLSFALNVQPPNPAFVQPPRQIVRQPADGSRQALLDPAGYLPQQVTIEALMDFPDGLPRALKETILLVDGKVAAHNTAPPFDRFVWDVSGIFQDERHVLQLEAEDQIGLVGYSIEIPVQVTVARPTEDLRSLLYLNAPRLALAAVLLALGVLFLWLVFSGRLMPRRPLAGRVHRPQLRLPHVEMPTRSLPPVRALGERLHWPRRRTTVEASPVRLERVDGGPALPVTASEVTLGSDPARAVLVVDDPSVSPLHARLRREEHGYRLFDAGSVAGTWVNYAPVPEEGVCLRSGDLVHLGRAAFRFLLADEPPPEPLVLPLAENEVHADR